MSYITETSTPGSKGKLQDISQPPDASRTPSETLTSAPLLYDTTFSNFAYTYHAVIHLKSRRLNLHLLLRDYITVINWGEIAGGENGIGDRGEEGRNPCAYSTVA